MCWARVSDRVCLVSGCSNRRGESDCFPGASFPQVKLDTKMVHKTETFSKTCDMFNNQVNIIYIVCIVYIYIYYIHTYIYIYIYVFFEPAISGLLSSNEPRIKCSRSLELLYFLKEPQMRPNGKDVSGMNVGYKIV